MSTIPLKELAFFKNGDIVDTKGGINVLTWSLDVSPSWLVETICSRAPHPVRLVTFINTKATHLRPLKKLGINLDDSSNSKFGLIDLSSVVLDTRPSDLAVKITSSLPMDGLALIILEFPDVLIGTGLTTANELVQLIYKVRNSHPNSSVFVVCNNDYTLVNDIGKLADSQASFLSQLFVQSSLIISLRPMSTGRADDVSGVIRLSAGGSRPSSPVAEMEYLYLVQGDTAKVFYR